MAEAIAALSLAANIVQFVTFTGDLISKTHEISRSADGALVENLELEAITSSLQELTHSLSRRAAIRNPSSLAEKELQNLCNGCHAVSKELLDVIQSLKVQGPHAGWNSFRQALKGVWKEDQIEDLSKRLTQYRSQIDTTLLMSLRENMGSFKTLLVKQQSKSDSARNDALYELRASITAVKQWQTEIMETLLRGDLKIQTDQDVEVLSSQLSTTVKSQKEENMRLKIVERLRYISMNDRFERIPTAYRRTYDWIFLEEENSVEGESRQREGKKSEPHPKAPLPGMSLGRRGHPWDNFVNWLHSDQDLYWITGKPGSGKSTLMKYLHNDPRTSNHLQAWRGNLPLMMAGFFFWNSGTTMQMSEKGLIQTLLHQAIIDDQDVIPTIFPDRWRYSQLFGNDFRPWSQSELNQALTALICNSSKKFFFFIDGVDEFQGDEMKLSNFLLEIASRKNVKMCVASRPWLVFEDAFQSRPSLRLEDLTAPDIRLFVRDNLRENKIFAQLQKLKPNEAEQLVLEVTEKAQGVFLWVHLVIVSLLEGLRDGDGIADLHERLLFLPSDLEELFLRILGCINPEYLKQASKFFQLVRAASDPVSLLTFSFAEEGYEEAMCAEVSPMPLDERIFRAETMRRRLNSRCKGLLDAPDFKWKGEKATIQYLHRTVKDFLGKESTGKYITSWTSNLFDADLNLCGGYMRYVKIIDTHPKMSLDEFWIPFQRCIEYSLRLEDREREFHIAILNELAKIGRDFFENKEDGRQAWLRILLAEHRRKTGLLVRAHWPATSMPFLDYAARYPLYTYVEYQLGNLDDEELQRMGHNMLVEAACGGDVRLVRVLLQKKVDPNFRVRDVTTWHVILRRSKSGAFDKHRSKDKTEWPAIIGEFLDYHAEPQIIVDDMSLEEIIRDNCNRWDATQADIEKLLSSLSDAQKKSSVSNEKPPKHKGVLRIFRKRVS